MDWLRTIADHTAAAIATARAFEQIEQLRAKLELENEYLRRLSRCKRSDTLGRHGCSSRSHYAAEGQVCHSAATSGGPTT